MDYTSESYLLEMGKKFRGANFKSSREAYVGSTFDQRYHAFLVRHSTRDVAVGIFLLVFSTLDKWSWEGTFGTHHELER